MRMTKKEFEASLKQIVGYEVESLGALWRNVKPKNYQDKGRPETTRHESAALAYQWERMMNGATAKEADLAIERLLDYKNNGGNKDRHRSASRARQEGFANLPAHGVIHAFDKSVLCNAMLLFFPSSAKVVFTPSYIVCGECWLWEQENQEVVFYPELELLNLSQSVAYNYAEQNHHFGIDLLGSLYSRISSSCYIGDSWLIRIPPVDRHRCRLIIYRYEPLANGRFPLEPKILRFARKDNNSE